MKKVITMVSCIVFTMLKGSAQITENFTVYKQLTQRGDITFAANTITTCSANVGTNNCGNAKITNPPGTGTPFNGTLVPGNTALNNNSYSGVNNMSYVDADGSSFFAGLNTFSSSRSFLNLSNNPGCSIIVMSLVY